MIRFIAAIDEKRGIADDNNIPWLGKLPSDTEYYRDKIKTGKILMGYGTYQVISKPYHERINYVATNNSEILNEGFEAVKDARAFIQNTDEDVWVLGGAGLFASTIDLADELYLTQVEGDFNCTKFFPKFEQDFELISKTKSLTENGIKFRFEVWKRKLS